MWEERLCLNPAQKDLSREELVENLKTWVSLGPIFKEAVISRLQHPDQEGSIPSRMYVYAVQMCARPSHYSLLHSGNAGYLMIIQGMHLVLPVGHTLPPLLQSCPLLPSQPISSSQDLALYTASLMNKSGLSWQSHTWVLAGVTHKSLKYSDPNQVSIQFQISC